MKENKQEKVKKRGERGTRGTTPRLTSPSSSSSRAPWTDSDDRERPPPLLFPGINNQLRIKYIGKKTDQNKKGLLTEIKKKAEEIKTVTKQKSLERLIIKFNSQKLNYWARKTK